LDETSSYEILWLVLIIFLPFLGSLLYFLIGMNQRTSRKERVKSPACIYTYNEPFRFALVNTNGVDKNGIWEQ